MPTEVNQKAAANMPDRIGLVVPGEFNGFVRK
jgi:hypothetical protein